MAVYHICQWCGKMLNPLHDEHVVHDKVLDEYFCDKYECRYFNEDLNEDVCDETVH